MLDFKKESLILGLTEKEKKEFLGDCSVIFKNPSFKKLCDELYSQQVMETVNSNTIEEMKQGQGIILGIQKVFDTIMANHAEFVSLTKQKEDFDKNEII